VIKSCVDGSIYVARADGTRELLPLAPPTLLPRQAGYMPYSPHMLLHFARAAARSHACAPTDGCAVVGDLWSSINGRPFQRFIDAHTDLATARVPTLSRPEWIRPLLGEFGNATWRRRYAWLRARLSLSNHSAAFFADESGGVFNETFPSLAPFPARALVLVLGGTIAVDVADDARDDVLTTRVLEPPHWHDGDEPMLTPASAPAEVPFGRRHAVRTLGSARSCFAYVFGAAPVGGWAPSRRTATPQR
jgi:hypothetical protein